MRNPLLARFDSVPSLVSPDMQGVFESCLSQAAAMLARIEADTTQPQMLADDDFWFADNDWRATLRPYVVKNGVLQVPVKGVLLNNFPYQLGGWATGYTYIWRAVERGMGDSNVRGIALVIDSPGGEVAGNFDLVDKMFALRGEKPIRAYAAESAYSAAYSIASVADSITVSRTGGVGSIGVVTAHVDVSAAMDQMGVKVTFIHAGKHKVDGNPYEALKPEVKERIQARIDELYGVFVSTVARNRGMDEKEVRDTEALTFTATQAVSNGLADTIGSLEDSVVSFARELEEGSDDMAQAQDTGKKPEGMDEALASARADGKNEGLKEGATAERARINAILGSDEGKKRPTAALAAALDTDMTADQATKFLGKLAEEKAAAPAEEPKAAAESPFDKAMGKTENPDLGAANQGDEKTEMSRAERAFIAAGRTKPKAA